MSYKRDTIKVANTTIDDEGYNTTGDGVQYDDLAFDLFGKRLHTAGGKVDHDWDKVALKFQKGGSMSNPADCAFGNEPYGHKWKASTSPTDYITLRPHFHWMQFNATDKYELTVKYRVLNNGKSYTDDDADWALLTVKTCDGHDVFPFDLDGGDFMIQITEFVELERFVDISAEFQVRITRTDNTAFSEDLYLTQFDFHCPIDSFGSIEPMTKYKI